MYRWSIILLAFITIGCGALKQPDVPAESYAMEPAMQQQIDREKSSFSETDRSLVYTAYFRISSLEPDSVHKKIISLSQKFEGYILESEIDKTTIRIKSKYLQEVVDFIEQTGDVIEKEIQGQDVTDKYLDLQVRLENTMKSRERYLALLDKADNINDILRIEKELERLNQKIDYLEGQIKQMSHQIEYATITVETSSEQKPGVVGSLFVGLYKGVKWLFVQ